MTFAAKIFVGPDGRQFVASWGEWQPTNRLRFVPYYGNKKLQQLMLRNGMNTAGHVCHTEQEWQDVPYEPDA